MLTMVTNEQILAVLQWLMTDAAEVVVTEMRNKAVETVRAARRSN